MLTADTCSNANYETILNTVIAVRHNDCSHHLPADHGLDNCGGKGIEMSMRQRGYLVEVSQSNLK